MSSEGLAKISLIRENSRTNLYFPSINTFPH